MKKLNPPIQRDEVLDENSLPIPIDPEEMRLLREAAAKSNAERGIKPDPN